MAWGTGALEIIDIIIIISINKYFKQFAITYYIGFSFMMNNPTNAYTASEHKQFVTNFVIALFSISS